MSVTTRKLTGLSERELAVRMPDNLEYLLDLDRRVSALEGSACSEKALHAMDMLMDAGRLRPGDVANEVLQSLAEARARAWSADMGWIGVDDFVTYEGDLYIAMQSHQTQTNAAPGTAGGLALFRLVRDEPGEGSGDVLEFVIGEYVPYGALRRDPVDGKVYTPVKGQGVTLYDHRPGLVPSEYKLVDAGEDGENPDPDEPPEETVPKWVDLPEGHLFKTGDQFLYNGKAYAVLRDFNKQAGWAPPALIDNFYELA